VIVPITGVDELVERKENSRFPDEVCSNIIPYRPIAFAKSKKA
jgi:hypothetical protein